MPTLTHTRECLVLHDYISTTKRHNPGKLDANDGNQVLSLQDNGKLTQWNEGETSRALASHDMGRPKDRKQNLEKILLGQTTLHGPTTHASSPI